MDERSVVSIDFDGFPFPRTGIQLDVFKPWSYHSPLKPKHSPITRSDRIPSNHPLSKKEQVFLDIHSRRYVDPVIATIIQNMSTDTKIGNTGRPNNKPMVDMTIQRLAEGGLSEEFEYVLFKPDGVSSDESKYWGLIELEEMGYRDITHYDDNARTVRRLAQVLPQVRFVIVQDLTSEVLFSRAEMEQFPNVARIGIRRSGKIDVVYKPAGFGDFHHQI